jgi:sulfopyruvate decarboxylase subunit alpha
MNASAKPGAAGDLLHGAGIIQAVKDAGVTYVLSVPDLHTAKGLLTPITSDKDLTLIRTCKEDECLGISAGLTYGNKRALILIQYTGFLYAMNSIRGVACEQKLPMVMMIGLLSKEVGVAPQDSKRFGLRIIEPILDVMGIERHYIDVDADVAKITPAIKKAYETSAPVAMLIGRKPV